MTSKIPSVVSELPVCHDSSELKDQAKLEHSILMIDDDKKLRIDLELELRNAIGYDVIGTDDVNFLNTKPYYNKWSIIIADPFLYSSSGRQVTALFERIFFLRIQHRRGIRGIITTRKSIDEVESVFGIEKGEHYSDYLQKPFTLRELYAVLDVNPIP